MNLKKNIATSDAGFIFNPSTGDSFSANPMAAEILIHLKQGLPAIAIKQIIIEKYDVEPAQLERDWDDFIISLANAPNPPNVISISYGGPESSVTSNQKYTFDYEAIKLGLIGTSVIVSSGDDGVAGNQARVSSIFCGYNPQFPASSPWVTAVGATQGPESGGEEVGIYFLILI
jgi:subtilase family serine protease